MWATYLVPKELLCGYTIYAADSVTKQNKSKLTKTVWKNYKERMYTHKKGRIAKHQPKPIFNKLETKRNY